MAKLYWKNNGTTRCFHLTVTQPSGHSLAVNNNGTTQYLKLSAGATSALNVNLNGTQYGAVSYPENTDILVTSDFICKRTATTEALCIYANGTQILNTAGTACNAISIPDNATITICGPVNACYLSATMQDGYYAANVTRQCACISMTAYACSGSVCTTYSTACIYGEYDWEQSINCQTWVASCPVNQCFIVSGNNLTGTHTISAAITSCIQNLSCTTTCNFTLSSGSYCCSLTPMATGSLTGNAQVCLPFCSSFKLNGTDIGNSGYGCMMLCGSYTSFNGYCTANTEYRYDTSALACCCFGTYSFTRVEA